MQLRSLGELAALSLFLSCGPDETPQAGVGMQRDGLVAQNGLSTNGLSTNGLSTNGLSTNGLSTNGLSTNGLSTNGLSTNGLSTNGLSTNGLSTNGLSTFAQWFATAPEEHAQLMKYVVRCAASARDVVNFTDPASGVAYQWGGLLDLAPHWSAGASASLYEQRIVSACLAAHVNKYGVHVRVSMQGLSSVGMPIPLEEGELQAFSEPEGCFFGNVFANEGVFVGLDHVKYGPEVESVRACALGNASCAPLIQIGQCAELCARDEGNTRYDTCSVNGVTFPAITTRLPPSLITSGVPPHP